MTLGWAQAPQYGHGAPPGWIVVLGAAQYNGRPSPILKGRLEVALRLYRHHLAPGIIVTGGKRPGDRYSEGEVGCRYLRDRGVPPTALRCETQSQSTWQNLSNIKGLVGKQGIVVVTDEPHLPRALYLAQSLGLNAEGYPVRGSFSASYYWREGLLSLLARLGVVR
nr:MULTISPECIES: YdcF family protein [unclassified Meiothermus]